MNNVVNIKDLRFDKKMDNLYINWEKRSPFDIAQDLYLTLKVELASKRLIKAQKEEIKSLRELLKLHRILS